MKISLKILSFLKFLAKKKNDQIKSFPRKFQKKKNPKKA